MGSHTQRLLNECATVATGLCGEAWIHSDDLMSSTRSLGFKYVEERAPGGIHDGFGQVMVFHHMVD